MYMNDVFDHLSCRPAGPKIVHNIDEIIVLSHADLLRLARSQDVHGTIRDHGFIFVACNVTITNTRHDVHIKDLLSRSFVSVNFADVVDPKHAS